MKLVRLSLLILVSGLSVLHAQTNGIDQTLDIVTAPTGEKLLQWQAKAGRCYFLQVSDPADHLNKWYWYPLIESGSGQFISHEVEATADKRFFRLHYTDQTANDLDNADFDIDGLTNLQEITPSNSTQTNPLDPDTDHDGTNDLDERYNQSNPTDPDSGGTPVGSDAGGASAGPSGGGPGSGGPGGGGTTPYPVDDIKLVYRGVNYNQIKWYGDYGASVQLHSASLLALFAPKIGCDTIGIKKILHGPGDEDDETINARPDSLTATNDYQKIFTYTDGETISEDSNPVFTKSDASSELHGMFVDLAVTTGDDLSTWKEAGNNKFALGGSEQYTNMGADPLWLTSRSTAKYQFAIRADATNSYPRHFTRDFLQVLTRYNEFTGLNTQSLANPHLISKDFTIAIGNKYSHFEEINTPESEIAEEYGVAKDLALVPVRMGDNIPATGVDITSRDTVTSDIGHQPYYWIMAPAGNVPGTNQKCNNAMQFKIPLPTGTRLKISCPDVKPSPAIISPRAGNEPTVAWHGTANSSDDKTPVFKVGTEESVVDLPIRVKVMKNRKVKVAVWQVRKNSTVDPMTSSEEGRKNLEAGLNKYLAYQLNAWMDVVIKPSVTFDYQDNQAANITWSQGASEKAMMDQYYDGDFDINIYLIRDVYYLFQDSSAPNGYGAVGGNSYPPSEPNSGIYKNRAVVTLGQGAGSAAQIREPADVIRDMAHEIGHIMIGKGHPDLDQGPATLEGTNRKLRLMCSGQNADSNSRLLVKSEWDKAELWLSTRPNGDN